MMSLSDKRRKRIAEAKTFRRYLVESVGRCERCEPQGKRSNKPLCVHEIANGPNRQKALDKPFAVLVLCWQCNSLATSKGEWSEASQLRCLLESRPEDFDLVAYNALINERAPNRITMDEVQEA